MLHCPDIKTCMSVYVHTMMMPKKDILMKVICTTPDITRQLLCDTLAIYPNSGPTELITIQKVHVQHIGILYAQ